MIDSESPAGLDQAGLGVRGEGEEERVLGSVSEGVPGVSAAVVGAAKRSGEGRAEDGAGVVRAEFLSVRLPCVPEALGAGDDRSEHEPEHP